MQKRTTARKTSSNREALKGALLVVGLAAWAAVEGAAGNPVIQSDGVKHEQRLFNGERGAKARRLSAGERKKIVGHVERAVERGLKAKYRRPPVNPSDDEVARMMQDVGQLLLAAAETAVEKKMHWCFREGVAEQLTSWHLTGHFFRAPILKDPEFSRRWNIVRRKLKCPIPDISEEP